MSQKPANQTEKHAGFYWEFFLQCEDALFRLDFEDPVGLDAGIETQCVEFSSASIGEFNDSFVRLLGDLTDVRADESDLAGLQEFFGFLNPTNIRRFLQNGLRLTELEFVISDRRGLRRQLVASLSGIRDESSLHSVWVQIRDMTAEHQRRQTTEEIERNWRLTQKIEALGRLAGGVAHDFNNFLAVIMLQNDMLNLQLPAGSPLRYRTDEMKKATNKAAAMVKQLLAVGRKQTLAPRPTEINSLILEFSKTLPGFLPDNVEILASFAPDAGICFVDQKQLVHSLFSLIENARDAMPEGGRLRIETAAVLLDRDSILHKSQPEGWFVQITVRDTGTGMDSQTLESVFEPFFSTKKSAKGVGLGLATVYGFVKQSKGFIWVESEMGKGTAFRIQFPRIDQPVSNESPAASDSLPA